MNESAADPEPRWRRRARGVAAFAPEAAVAFVAVVEVSSGFSVGPFTGAPHAAPLRLALIVSSVTWFFAIAIRAARPHAASPRSVDARAIVGGVLGLIAIAGSVWARSAIAETAPGMPIVSLRRTVALAEATASVADAARFATTMLASFLAVRSFETVAGALTRRTRWFVVVLAAVGFAAAFVRSVGTTAAPFGWSDTPLLAIALPAAAGCVAAIRRGGAHPMAWLGLTSLFLVANSAATTRVFESIESVHRSCMALAPDTPLTAFSGPSLYAATRAADACSLLAFAALVVAVASTRLVRRDEHLGPRWFVYASVLSCAAQVRLVHWGAEFPAVPADVRADSLPTFDGHELSTRWIAAAQDVGSTSHITHPHLVFGRGPDFALDYVDRAVVELAREAPSRRRVVRDVVAIAAPADMPLSHLAPTIDGLGLSSDANGFAFAVKVDVHLDQPGIEPRPNQRTEFWAIPFNLGDRTQPPSSTLCTRVELRPDGTARESGESIDSAYSIEVDADPRATVRDLVRLLANLPAPSVVYTGASDRPRSRHCRVRGEGAIVWTPVDLDVSPWEWLSR